MTLVFKEPEKKVGELRGISENVARAVDLLPQLDKRKARKEFAEIVENLSVYERKALKEFADKSGRGAAVILELYMRIKKPMVKRALDRIKSFVSGSSAELTMAEEWHKRPSSVKDGLFGRVLIRPEKKGGMDGWVFRGEVFHERGEIEKVLEKHGKKRGPHLYEFSEGVVEIRKDGYLVVTCESESNFTIQKKGYADWSRILNVLESCYYEDKKLTAES